MTTFVFTQALNAVNSKINQVKNVYSNSIIGQYVDYEQNKTKWKKDKITGKLSEISIQTSTYNKIIPIIYGTNKLAGNVIWLGEINEVVNNNTTTLKIGKGQKVKQISIEYLYYLSFAIAICKGKIMKLNNVWADTKLLNLTNYTYRFYDGTEEQKPDTLIEAIEGIGNVTAYKEICYIVFENFPLSEFNNRIPNFLFEITRQNDIKISNNFSLEKCIKGINIVPPYGEALLHTVLQYEAGEQFVPEVVDWVEGIWYPLNANNNSKIADGLLSLNTLLETLPNCEFFVVHVAFFGDSMNISDCTLKPRVSFNFFYTGYPIYTRTDKFNIGTKWNRYNTPLLSENSDGKHRFFSGSISDGSLLSFYDKLKENGKKLVFTPDILLDIENTPSKKLLTGNVEDIHNFFTKENGYNEFILHYAELLKDYVDIFIIGNELTGLTSLQKIDDYSFPAVDELIDLAKQVKKIVGNKVKVSYAAGYKEYHNFNGWYNLDKLWSCDYIDFVGINAYFPLTNSPQDEITKNIIKEGWFSGENYDYNIVNGVRVKISNEYACKNMKYWWENIHTNPDGTITNWIPKSKKISFTEYGFCSIECATNEPYKQPGELPIYSNGNIDFFAQRTAIEATEEVFENAEYIENKFVYCWDARPYPFFPNKTDIWPDCEEWKYNYCLNGKTGISNANVLIYQLFKDADLDINLIEKIEIDEFVDGLIINNSLSVRDILYILQKVYFFDCIESNGKIKFISNKNSVRNKQNIINIYEDDLMANNNNNYINIDIINTNNLPKKLNLIFIDKNNDYDTTSVYSERNSIESNKIDIETIPIVLDEDKARNVAEISLYLSWLEKTIFNFILPIKYICLDASDLIKLHFDKKAYLLKIKTLVIEDNMLKIQATQFDNEIYNYKKTVVLNPNLEILKDVGNTNLKIIELPAINQNMINKIYLFFLVTSEFSSWKGANIYYSANSGRTYNVLDSTTKNSLLGHVFNKPIFAKPYYFDYENKLSIFFHSGIDTDLLENVNISELYDGANMALYGNEIIQFKNISLNYNGSYTVSGLLRGLYNTEKHINTHNIGDIFIILNNNILTQEFNFDKINFIYNYKAVSFDKDLADAKSIFYNIEGLNLKPFTPCHFRYKIIQNNLILNWKEKGRGYINWIDNSDYISIENEEKYCLEIFSNEKIIDTIYLNNKEYIFNIENIIFPLKIKLYQINQYGISDSNTLLVHQQLSS